MKAKISNSYIQGKINAPLSKSLGIRLIFLSLLTKVALHVSQELSDDLLVARNSVNALKEGKDYVYLRGSATTLRMFIPIALALGKRIKIDGDETLRRRPLSAIIKALRSAKFSSNSLPLIIEGKLENETEIEGWESSQYISGLIYAYHMIGGGKIKIIPPISSRSYIEMTVDLFNRLGSDVKFEGNEIYVNPKPLRSYEGEIPGDYALASFYALASLLTKGKVEILGLYDPPDYFGDHNIVEIISKMGAKSYYLNSWIVEATDEYLPIKININDVPDLAISIATLSAIANGNSEIQGVERLKIKESDRISTIISTLSEFGVKARYVSSSIIIEGKKREEIKRGRIICPADHRIAMMSGVLSLVNGGEVDNAECVNKSNPLFWQDLIKLGGKISLE
ncbi:3-phosphoshikimate 1-carboxyvinyltransferase [Acidianus sp. HS-5]|uniref:3-phosphoshikimate 1-carboxyvinyltransferase n=1 Tax=Acidianus sp. HS-5 TaxID=2886040 RepID=UPI001F1EEE25|nr:3-phosphoshikimate 1-carboxyvinyltransferase [Acidianus sp. HS-5]BDC19721.1 3-phosphoshikimate 1-carboxyvinyltransferase [Acidianus sp. HS-5]